MVYLGQVLDLAYELAYRRIWYLYPRGLILGSTHGVYWAFLNFRSYAATMGRKRGSGLVYLLVHTRTWCSGVEGAFLSIRVLQIPRQR